jgi:predicted Zn-dependent protease
MPNKPAFRFWFSIYAFTAVILTLAVGVFAWLASESRKEAGEGRTANARPAVGRHVSEERYQLLARFDPPAYTPSSKDRQHAPHGFEQAMAFYSKADFAAAIPMLRPVAAAQPDFLPARFYLGICLLLTNERASGIQELRAVISAPASPYLEPARFYLAKALLGAGDRSAARQQLEALVAMHDDLEKQAQVLLSQIQ